MMADLMTTNSRCQSVCNTRTAKRLWPRPDQNQSQRKNAEESLGESATNRKNRKKNIQTKDRMMLTSKKGNVLDKQHYMNMNKGQEYISLIGQVNFSNFAFIKQKRITSFQMKLSSA